MIRKRRLLNTFSASTKTIARGGTDDYKNKVLVEFSAPFEQLVDALSLFDMTNLRLILVCNYFAIRYRLKLYNSVISRLDLF